MDDIDLRILTALEENARTPVAELARRVGLSGRATGERMRRLEDEGIIAGYCLVVNRAKLGFNVRAWVCVRARQDSLPKLISFARDNPAIREAHRTASGFVLSVNTHDQAELTDLLRECEQFGPVEHEQILATPIHR